VGAAGAAGAADGSWFAGLEHPANKNKQYNEQNAMNRKPSVFRVLDLLVLIYYASPV
jgi:hypothetical protein